MRLPENVHTADLLKERIIFRYWISSAVDVEVTKKKKVLLCWIVKCGEKHS